MAEIERTFETRMDDRAAVYTADLLSLEAGGSFWLFEDGTRIAWDTLTGDEGIIESDISMTATRDISGTAKRSFGGAVN